MRTGKVRCAALGAPESDTMKRIPELDGVRGVAVLMVMGFHAFQDNPLASTPVLKTIGRFSVIGQTGVDLFFILSGFLITRILLSSKNSQHYFRDFYIRRTLRIFPLYYGFLLFTYFALPALLQVSPPSFAKQSWFWLYLQNVPMTFTSLPQASGPGHFWSLAIEEHFYLFWPVAVRFLPVKTLYRFVASLCLFAFLCRCVLLSFGVGIFFFTLCRMDALAIGALLAMLESQDRLNLIKKHLRWATAGLTVAVAILWPSLTGSRNLYWQAVKFPIIAAFFMASIGILVSGYISSLLRLGILPRIGQISYGLYVFHPLCFYVCFQRLGLTSFWLALPLALTVTLLVAAISFRFYEAPFLAIKERLAQGGITVNPTSSALPPLTN